MPPLRVLRYRRMTAWINRLMEDCAETLQTGTEAQQHQQKNNRITQPSGAATPRNSDAHERIAVPKALCVLQERPRPRPKSGKVRRSDTRSGDVCERAERSEGSDSGPVRKAPVSACVPLCAILLAKVSVYPLLLVKANMGRLCEKLKNALKSGLEQRCNSNFLAIFVEVILWFFDRLRKAPALLAPEPSLSLTSQVQRKF